MDDRIDDLHRRIEALERRDRRTRRWGGAALVVALAAGALGLAAAQDVPRVLKAEQLQVVDGKGNVRVELGTNEGAQGAYVVVSNEKGETRFALATGAPLGSVLTMYGRGDGSESPGVMMQARPGKQMPVLAIVSPEGSASAELTFEAADVPQFVLNDGSGKAVFRAVGKPSPLVSLASSANGAKVEIGFESPDRPQVSLRDRTGKEIFKAPK
jgi:hypothetical protein